MAYAENQKYNAKNNINWDHFLDKRIAQLIRQQMYQNMIVKDSKEKKDLQITFEQLQKWFYLDKDTSAFIKAYNNYQQLFCDNYKEKLSETKYKVTMLLVHYLEIALWEHGFDVFVRMNKAYTNN